MEERERAYLHEIYHLNFNFDLNLTLNYPLQFSLNPISILFKSAGLPSAKFHHLVLETPLHIHNIHFHLDWRNLIN